MRSFVLLIIIFLFISCEEESDSSHSCNDVDLIGQESWLSEIVDTLEKRNLATGYEIIQYDYKGSTVFYVDDCPGCADNLIQVYDCEGSVICEFGGIAGINTCPNFFDLATDSTMLIDSVARALQSPGLIRFDDNPASDVCGFLFEADGETYIPINLNSPYLKDSLPVLINYSLTGDSVWCGFTNIYHKTIEIQSINEIGETVLDSATYLNAPNDYLNIQYVGLSDDWLLIKFYSSGCSGDSWSIKLVGAEDIAESNPPQRNIRLSLENLELCDAEIERELVFDIYKFKRDNGSIILNLEGYKDQILYQ